MKRLLLGLLAATSMAAAAAADTAPSRTAHASAPVAFVPAFSWGGFYAGLNGGYGWGTTNYHFLQVAYYNFDAGDRFGHNTDGWLFGGHIGYNHQINNIVVGLEGSLAWSNIGKSNVISPYYPVTDRYSAKVGWLASITPRIGIALDRWLIYVKGGVAFADLSSRVLDNRFYANGNAINTGWTVGAGVEYAITNSLVLGVEYNYYDLGSYRVFKFVRALGTGVPTNAITDHRVKTTVNAVTARVSYKF